MNRLARFLAIVGLLIAPTAWADIDEVCISTTTDLAAALLQAESTPLKIKLVQGTYRLDHTPWNADTSLGNAQARGGSSLLGGYTGATCSGRDIDPANTTFDDDGMSHEYIVYFPGNFTLEGLTLHLGNVLEVIGGSDTQDATVNIRHDVFAANSPTNRLAILWVGSAVTQGTVHISDALVHGGTAHCGITVETSSGYADYYFVNDTVANTAIGLCLYDDHAALLRARYFIYNTIIYNNSVSDLHADTGTPVLVDDTIAMLDTPMLFTTPIGLKTGDPQLDGNYRPVAPDSPSIDSGTDIVSGGLPSTDIEGNPRVVGDAVDRGAYESPYDGSTKQTVTNTANAGAGSLRQAIKDANLTAGANSIVFNIAGNCPQVIAVASNLDAITGDTTINGYTQSGTSRNTLDTGDDANICIIVEPSASSTATDGLSVAAGAGNGVNLTVEGLALGGFSGDGIGLKGGSAHSINGNHFGGTVNGHALAANGFDIRLGAGVHDSIVGGDGAGQRNIIGDATNSGIYIAGTGTPAHDNQIVNNYIGLGWGSDFINRGNGTNGIYLAGTNNSISDNVIGDNGNDGIDVDTTAATGNTITSNSIGGVFGIATAFGNGLAGVRVENAAGDNTITSNTVANNTNAGVRIVTGMHNKIRKNAIYTNGDLGIDLATGGVTPNDPDGGVIPVDYANRGQNFPLLTAATGGHFSGQVTGTLSTTPGDYTVDLYLGSGCDASGNGEGRQWLRGTTITVPVPTIGTEGLANFVITIDTAFSNILTGSTLTSTATDSLGNTSEFSACQSYTDDTLFANGFDPSPF